MALAKGFVGHGSGGLVVSSHPLPAVSLALLKGVSTLEGAGFGVLLKKIKTLCIRNICCELNFFLSEEFVTLFSSPNTWHCCHSLDGVQALPQWQLHFGRRSPGLTHP